MKQRPQKAFILAAGFGTRMLPLTRVVPKPMLPLWGVPMIDRTLKMVRSWGVKDVVVNVHHGADVLIHHLVNNPHDGQRIQISHEPDILGTGGALTKASWFFDDGKPFWMVNADVGARVNVEPVLKAFKPGKTIASSWLMASRGPRTVECEGGKIVNFRSERPGTDGTFTFCGIHLVDPKVLKYLPASGFASIIDAYEKAMKRGWAVAGAPIENAWWSDMGTPAQYIQAHSETDPGKKRSFTSIDRTAVVHKSARIKNSVILHGAKLGANVHAENMIFGPNVSASKCSGLITMRAVDALDEKELALVKKWATNTGSIVASSLSPRGSSRTFTRIYSGSNSAILIRHNPDRHENNLYSIQAKFLAGLSVPVPEVLAEDQSNNLALYEDVGEQSVQDKEDIWTNAKLESTYRDVLEGMVLFHEEGARVARRKKLPLMPAFTGKLYAWEHALFTDLLLKERMGMSDTKIQSVRKDLLRVSRRLQKIPPVLIHRDLQSSNIMLKGTSWCLIDFQGMRFGPAVYDLASLLCDPYIKIDREVRERLLYHYDQAANPLSACCDEFWFAVIQRLAQALGAYARFGKNPNTKHFTSYIRPALLNVEMALEKVGSLTALEDVVKECLNREK